MNASLLPRMRCVCCAALLLLFNHCLDWNSSSCHGDLVQGVFIGVFPDNDTEESVSIDVVNTVFQLAKVEEPATMNDGLSIFDIVFNEDDPPEPISGKWSYSGPELVDYLIIKAGNEYAIYDYTDADMRNMGIWDTTDLDNKGLSHMTAYTLNPIPEPGAALALGLLLLSFAMRRRSR